MATPAPRIGPCPRHLRPAALRQLHDSLPENQQSVLTHAVRKIELSDSAAWDGLLVARQASNRGERAEGVLWVQRVAGNTAVLWARPGDDPTIEALVRAAARFVDDRGIPLTQLAVSAREGYSTQLLTRCGFPKLCELIYMYADVPVGKPRLPEKESPTTAGGRDIEFVPQAAADRVRLAALLERTYSGTLDCPQLDRVRTLTDVLEGYQAQGRCSPQDWYYVQERGVDIGALILADHPEFANWELVYMGVVPEARGRGIGRTIITFASKVAAARGGERLVLAVDEANTPARETYEQCGLREWDRRVVYARLYVRT